MIPKLIIISALTSISVTAATSASATIKASTNQLTHQFLESSKASSETVSWKENKRNNAKEFIKQTKNETETSRGSESTSFWELRSPEKSLTVSIKNDNSIHKR